MLTFGSVCSGIEAASVAWHHYGWRALWLAEVDRAASDVLTYRFPDVPNHGDMTKLAACVRAREIPAPDVLVGGTPCQSFSIAGLRGGLADARGQLTLAFIDLANAIDEVRAEDGKPPVIIVWENVPGVLTHADNPLGCFLAGLAGDDDALEPGPRPESARSSAYWTWDKKAGVHRAKWPVSGCVAGPQRAVAWTVKDAQWFGLAQRRRRVFVVASARQGIDPAAILLEFDGVRRDSAPSREPGEGVTHPVAPCLTGSGRGTERTGDPRGQDAFVAVFDEGRTDGVGLSGLPRAEHGEQCSTDRVPDLRMVRSRSEQLRQSDVVATLDASYGRLQGCSGQDANHGHSHLVAVATAYGGNNQSGPIDVATARNAHSGPHGRLDFESETFVLEPIVFHPTQDPISDETGVCHTIGTGSRGGTATAAIAFSVKDYGGDCSVGVSPTLRGMGHDGSHANGGGQVGVAYPAVLPFNTTQVTDPRNGSQPRWGDTDHPIAAGAHPPAIAELYSIMPMNSGKDFKARAVDVAQPLMAGGPVGGPVGGNQGGDYVLETTMAVRRLMPVECERLQGFPDGWTLVPTGKRGKPAADGPRYKQCGNSMATNVMRWIGGRIDRAVRALLPPGDDFDELMIGHNNGPALDDFEELLA